MIQWVRPRKDLARECAPGKGLWWKEGMEMSQGSPESLGAPVQRVRRESSGFPPREEESRSPHSQQGVGWSPTGSRGQLGWGNLPCYLCKPLGELMKIRKNLGISTARSFFFFSRLPCKDVRGRQLQAGKPDVAVGKFTGG